LHVEHRVDGEVDTEQLMNRVGESLFVRALDGAEALASAFGF